jgi:hypothetical protein
MADVVSALGYSVPLFVLVVGLAVVIGLALAVMFWLTTGISIYRSVQDTRRQRVRDDIQSRLLDGVFSTELEWGPWVADLSDVERAVLEELLDQYLRELDGDNVERLRELGAELGIPARSKRHLERGGEYTRLQALTWLTLLERPEQLHAAAFTPTSSRERAAVARLRYETDDLDSPAEGISLLLDDATSQFSIFGQDTLYRIALDDSSSLFSAAERNYRQWSQPLLIQVLTVCQHLGTSITTEDLSWLIRLLEHDHEAVRAAATRALSTVGWRQDIRNELFLARLVRDPSAQVRSAVYEMLAEWGDESAIETLSDALVDEENSRARLAGTDALVRRVDALPADSSSHGLVNTWAWSREHAAFDQTVRQRGDRSTP